MCTPPPYRTIKWPWAAGADTVAGAVRATMRATSPEASIQSGDIGAHCTGQDDG